MQRETFVIVGASLAGASAAAALRKEGFDGRLFLIGEEAERPYERPDLSKKYLRGEPDAKVYVHPDGFYDDADVELLTDARVDRIDAARATVHIGSRSIRFDRLLVTTGAAPRRLAVPGGELEGIVTLRTIHDADRIRDAASGASAVAVVGGGWIGSEVAASLRQLGHDVTLVLPAETPIQRVLGREVGGVYRRAHERNGVRLVAGSRVVGFDGRSRVSRVLTDDGRSLPADLVVVGVGAEPRTELALAAGIQVRNGILVDDRLETSVPGIYAAGDAANAWHRVYGRHLRVEHWDNAKRQGRAAAASMIGRAKAYDRIPYFYSDQYDLGMEYTGFARTWDRVVFRGDPNGEEFIAFWLHDGRVTAGMNMNVWDVAPSIERLVRSGERVDPRHLADESRPLEQLAAA